MDCNGWYGFHLASKTVTVVMQAQRRTFVFVQVSRKHWSIVAGEYVASTSTMELIRCPGTHLLARLNWYSRAFVKYVENDIS